MPELPHDVKRFAAALRTTLRGLFTAGVPLTVSRAPGRLDVMGGIADYSGSLTLEGTLAEATVCGVQLRSDRTVRVRSLNAEAATMEPEVRLSLDELKPCAGSDPYEAVGKIFQRDPRRKWAGYLAGMFAVLIGEGVVSRFERGVTIAVRSDVPLGAGVSSSAALEVAAMMAVKAAYGLEISGLRLAALCQMVENRIIGAPCGIMDQVASALGEAGKLLALRCQPHELEGAVRLPPGIRVVGFYTRVKHAVGGSRYTDTRIGAFMGERIISQARRRRGEDDSTGGYLANITPEEYVARWRRLLPASLNGAEFLARYGKTRDAVTTVSPDTTYMVRSRTEHPIYENARVRRFREHLAKGMEGNTGGEMAGAGKLMYGSHWSYGHRCGLGSRETDLVVRMVREKGPKKGFYGAKITGGGSGGTVAILCRDDTDEQLGRIAEAYERETGNAPTLFRGTGPGAFEFGTRTLRT